MNKYYSYRRSTLISLIIIKVLILNIIVMTQAFGAVVSLTRDEKPKATNIVIEQLRSPTNYYETMIKHSYYLYVFFLQKSSNYREEADKASAKAIYIKTIKGFETHYYKSINDSFPTSACPYIQKNIIIQKILVRETIVEKTSNKFS